jgi:hypothetical protein
MSTLEEIPIENSGNTNFWVMDPSLFDVKMTHYCLVMVDKKYKWELQSGPLMVKSLTGRCFAD